MKPQELRKLSDERLNELKSELSFKLFKSKSPWGIGQVKEDKTTRGETKLKGFTKKGTNTAIIKNIKITIARINTILNERRVQ